MTFNQAASGTYAGTMSGTGALTKTGAGNCYISVKDYGGGPERSRSSDAGGEPSKINFPSDGAV